MYLPTEPTLDGFVNKFNRLDRINKLLFELLVFSLDTNDSASIKAALDGLVDHNGNSPDLIDAYTTFGLVPFVMGAHHG